MGPQRSSAPLERLLADPTRRDRITHVESVPARQGRRADWPQWSPRLLLERLEAAGIEAPWEHQAVAAEHARAGRSVIIATGTASGKSLAYLLPAVAAIYGEERSAASGEQSSAKSEALAAARAVRRPARRRRGAMRKGPWQELTGPWIAELKPALSRVPKPRDNGEEVSESEQEASAQALEPATAQAAEPPPHTASAESSPRASGAKSPPGASGAESPPRTPGAESPAHGAGAESLGAPHSSESLATSPGAYSFTGAPVSESPGIEPGSDPLGNTPNTDSPADALRPGSSSNAPGLGPLSDTPGLDSPVAAPDSESLGGALDGSAPGSKSAASRVVGIRPADAAKARARVSAKPDGTVLYLSPTKALAADQLRALRDLHLTRVRAATFDGDTPRDERDWVRQHANYVLTNPDMLHRSILPSHARWASFLRRLRYVVIDEAHGYRGVFGSHVAQVLRRLRRVCAKYGAEPVFILASATTSEPAIAASRLTGLDVVAVSDDASPRGPATFALWEPPLTDMRGERGAPIRRTATAETGDLLADLVVEGVQTLAFVRSRRGAESVALSAKRALGEVAPPLAEQVAAYRAGYLPEERRALEASLRSREVVGLATTNALELGVDVSGLDAVVVCGWPGTRASLWQQAGRAGRSGQAALAVLVARDDPLDTFLVHHPEAIFGTPVESTVLDPDNPYVLEPHLCAAASELPLTDADLELFGPTTTDLLPDLVRRGFLRHRPSGWYWTRRDKAADLADIRGAGGAPIQVVEAATGRLLGTVDEAASHTTVHEGAVYIHQGESFIVQMLDLDDSVALVEAAEPDYLTTARDVTDISIVERLRSTAWGEATLCLGTVEVTRQVVAYQMRRTQTGEMLGEKPLDLPARTLRTRAVWWTLSPEQVEAFGDMDLAGAAHAAEHASIGLLPLFATCDRWDIGGVSTAVHPDTGLLTVFVYDGHEGGAGFAERGYSDAAEWLHATQNAIESCECESGCPSCIQSPKCGNGNEPLDKQGALTLLAELLRHSPTP